jgi:predicted patatin/cPLA2 family phospholipase
MSSCANNPTAAAVSSVVLDGIRASEAIEACKQRLRRQIAGDRQPDGRKLALVIEGGAMRGAALGGGVVALEQLGMTGIFDEVYATSAGAIVGGYFLSGQADLGITIYFDDLTTGRFINPFRPWKVVDLDYVFDEVISDRKRLDTRKILDSPTRFLITLMDSATGQAFLVDTRSTSAPLLDVIKAAMAMPVFYNRTVDIEGKQCMDGGLRIPFPLQEAIDNGCTDILLLLARRKDFIAPPPTWIDQLLFDLICARGRTGLSQAYANYHLPCRSARDLAFGRIAGPPPTVNIATFCLEKTEHVHHMTVNRRALRAAAVSYGQRVLRAFGAECDSWNLGPPPVMPDATASANR